MTRSKNILEEYRRGDLDKRLNLFLECPSLRSWFMEIDKREMAGECSGETPNEADAVGKGLTYS